MKHYGHCIERAYQAWREGNHTRLLVAYLVTRQQVIRQQHPEWLEEDKFYHAMSRAAAQAIAAGVLSGSMKGSLIYRPREYTNEEIAEGLRGSLAYIMLISTLDARGIIGMSTKEMIQLVRRGRCNNTKKLAGLDVMANIGYVVSCGVDFVSLYQMRRSKVFYSTEAIGAKALAAQCRYCGQRFLYSPVTGIVVGAVDGVLCRACKKRVLPYGFYSLERLRVYADKLSAEKIWTWDKEAGVWEWI